MANVYFEKKNGENLLLNESGIDDSGSGYIKFSDGTLICYGSYVNRTLADNFIISLPCKFISAPSVFIQQPGNGESSKFWLSDMGESTITISASYTGSEIFYICFYLAIGKWK